MALRQKHIWYLYELRTEVFGQVNCFDVLRLGFVSGFKIDPVRELVEICKQMERPRVVVFASPVKRANNARLTAKVDRVGSQLARRLEQPNITVRGMRL